MSAIPQTWPSKCKSAQKPKLLLGTVISLVTLLRQIYCTLLNNYNAKQKLSIFITVRKCLFRQRTTFFKYYLFLWVCSSLSRNQLKHTHAYHRTNGIHVRGLTLSKASQQVLRVQNLIDRPAKRLSTVQSPHMGIRVDLPNLMFLLKMHIKRFLPMQNLPNLKHLLKILVEDFYYCRIYHIQGLCWKKFLLPDFYYCNIYHI